MYVGAECGARKYLDIDGAQTEGKNSDLLLIRNNTRCNLKRCRVQPLVSLRTDPETARPWLRT